MYRITQNEYGQWETWVITYNHSIRKDRRLYVGRSLQNAVASLPEECQ